MRKKTVKLISLFALCLVCCIAVSSCVTQMNVASKRISNDAACQVHWGEAFSRSLQDLSFGAVYKLNPVAERGERMIARYVVDKRIGSFKKRHSDAMKSALNDASFYNDDKDTFLKTFFAPYIAIELTKSMEAKYLLISFSNEEWAIATDSKVIAKCRFSNINYIKNIILEISPKDKYLEEIK